MSSGWVIVKPVTEVAVGDSVRLDESNGHGVASFIVGSVRRNRDTVAIVSENGRILLTPHAESTIIIDCPEAEVPR